MELFWRAVPEILSTSSMIAYSSKQCLKENIVELKNNFIFCMCAANETHFDIPII